jgi:hypothetical protein
MPSGVDPVYFTVQCHLAPIVADISSDADYNPNTARIDAVVTFVPNLRNGEVIHAATANPPTGFIPLPVTAMIDDGYLKLRARPDTGAAVVPGTLQARLAADGIVGNTVEFKPRAFDYAPVRLLGNSDSLNLEGDYPLYYTFSFSSIKIDGKATNISITGGSFEAPWENDAVIDLLNYMPLPAGPYAAGMVAGPPGADGPPGPPGPVTADVGSTATGEPGTEAIVTNSGTTQEMVLDFVIPRGADGADGVDGVDGAVGPIGPMPEGAEFEANKGQPDGYAPLGSDSLVPPEHLPPQEPSVLEFSTGDDFPEAGQTGVIYVDVSTGDCYRWNPDAAAMRQKIAEEAEALADGLDAATTLEGRLGADDAAVSVRGAARAVAYYNRISERVKVTGIEAAGTLSANTYLRGDGVWSPAYTSGVEGLTDRLLDRMTVRAPDSRRLLMESLIRDLMSRGLWDKLDALYVFAAHHAQAGRLNWKSSVIPDAISVNSPVFEVDRGFTGDGGSSYLDTEVYPSDYVQYQDDDATIGVYVRTSVSLNVNDISMNPYSGIVTAAGDNIVVKINSSSYFNGNNSGDRTGLFAASRLTGANTVYVYKDGVSAGSGAQSAPVPANFPAQFLKAGLDSYSTRQLAAGFIGGGLTAREHADLNTALTVYFTAIGAAV